MTQVVILTGAGISAESGLGTFRDEGGLWAQHAIEDVATPEGFARNPTLVHRFYNARRKQAAEASPNAAHLALVRLEQALGDDLLIVTQNVDDLHERAGARNVLHMHGELAGALCHRCGHRWSAPLEMSPTDACPACNSLTTRPDVVWFGEVPYGMERIDPALTEAELFVSIGTSGQVYPAAAYAQHAKRMGARTLELNMEPSANARDFDDGRYGPATEVVPAWVEEMLGACGTQQG